MAQPSSVPSPHPVDERLPAGRLVPLAFQHVLVMYAGAVAVPLIVGRALQLPPEDVAFLISADLFACGIATLIQSLGLLGTGIRLPVMMGVTFASVGPMLAMGTLPEVGLLGIYGSVIAAGLFGILVAPLVGRVLPLFPPVVTGTIILVIGISLMRVGINWAGGGLPTLPRVLETGERVQVPNAAYGAPASLLMAAFVLLVILAILRWGRGFLGNVAVLAGIVAGAAVATALGLMSFEKVAAAPWFGLVLPFHFGWPQFHLVPILTMCLVMIVVMIESLGMFLALGEMTDRKLDRKAITRGLRADGVGTLIGVILLALGLSPKMAALVEAVPVTVLGGAGLVMFGMVAATGIRILSAVDFKHNRGDLFVVAVSIGFGLIPLVAPGFFHHLPRALQPLLESGILLAAIAAVVLNLFFNRLETSERAQSHSAGAAGASEHV